MDKIKVIKNVITPEDAKPIIEYINRHVDNFIKAPGLKRFTRMFGYDVTHQHMSKVTIEGELEDIRNLVRSYVNKAIGIIEDEYKDTGVLLSSLWFAKQIDGGDIRGHSDIDNGLNDHFVYSAVLYLNTVEDGGALDFPKLGISVKPVFGDLVIFPSHGDDMFHEVKRIGEDRYTLPMWFTKNKENELLSL
jgi:hypothetical protein